MITYCDPAPAARDTMRITTRLGRRKLARRPDATQAMTQLIHRLLDCPVPHDATTPEAETKAKNADSVERLERAREALPMLELYRRTFPDEWRQSATPAFAGSRDYPCYTSREVEFMRLVERHICPVALDWLDGAEERYPYIPLWEAPAWDIDEDSEPHNWRHAYQLAVALNRLDGGRTLDWYRDSHGLAPAEDFTPRGSRDWQTFHREPLVWSWELFEQACSVIDTPLKFLPRAISVTSHDTGNVFFDYTYEMQPPEFGWNAENIEHLRETYAEYQQVCDEMKELSDHLDAREIAAAGEGTKASRARVRQAFRLYDLAFVPRGINIEPLTKGILYEAGRILAGHVQIREAHAPAQQLALFD